MLMVPLVLALSAMVGIDNVPVIGGLPLVSEKVMLGLAEVGVPVLPAAGARKFVPVSVGVLPDG